MLPTEADPDPPAVVLEPPVAPALCPPTLPPPVLPTPVFCGPEGDPLHAHAVSAPSRVNRVIRIAYLRGLTETLTMHRFARGCNAITKPPAHLPLWSQCILCKWLGPHLIQDFLSQAPPEHNSLHVAPSGQSVLQGLLPQLTEQLAPEAHLVLQLPPAQFTLHFDPFAHSASQAPPSHCRRHSAPEAHFILHLPAVQLSAHFESAAHESSQRPAAQSLSQFELAAHVCLQPPFAHASWAAGFSSALLSEALAFSADAASDLGLADSVDSPFFSLEAPSEAAAAAGSLDAAAGSTFAGDRASFGAPPPH